ncbi:transcriptional regulator with XRE-family HTH domain [Algoriphagus sp. 4150]|uniref:helix-turn-helix domain-containing protein n=1 Tax=Algoriphagus sp. 4150 TaxID=2817756 RepID=UPI00285FB822|nr:helix-turn-helix domain-containing protein [Algoriphagus sp. 4150]MDR7130983.1 transcriptional regulator with XRE-family HTH domain [Algoriphagus sp. 4150]
MKNPNEKLTPKAELLKSIGDRMEFLRKLEGYTNHDVFSYDKGINRTQYGKYENGKSDIRISTLIRIIHSYNEMTIEKFFEGVKIPDEFIKSITKSE